VSADVDLIYLDYAATTPPAPQVLQRMREVQATAWFNPSSNHLAGRKSAAVIHSAAEQLATLLNAAPESLVWTSGATEANNLAIMGAAKQREHRGKHLVTMRTEHKAVVDVFRALEKQGFDVTWLEPDKHGHLSVERFAAALRDDTQLASIMHVNNETGAIQDIKDLGSVCRQRGIVFHVDGAQACGKMPLDLTRLPIDLYSLTAHKFYGPKGIGALFVADGTPLAPLMFGGGQQRRLRPGTLAVELIAGLGEAAALAAASIARDLLHLSALKEQLIAGIQDIEGIHINGPEQGGYPGILNVGLDDIEGESLLLALEPLCVATGSACNSRNQEPSYVLRALGRSDLEAQSAIRFSFGRMTTPLNIEAAISLYRQGIGKLRGLAPAVVK
jgi:cysteine desulfurase